MALHGRPAVILGSLVIPVGVQAGFAFRGWNRETREGVPLDDCAATLTITSLDKEILFTVAGYCKDNVVSFYLTAGTDVPDVGEYVVELDPNPFSQPRFAQGKVTFDRTAQG